jgi:hypothetical protein
MRQDDEKRQKKGVTGPEGPGQAVGEHPKHNPRQIS